MLLKSQTQQLLKKYGVAPNKVLGQNFLVDQRIIGELINSINISKKDTVVEVGPGIGTITKELAKTAKKVLAIEKDPHLIPVLQKELANFNNVEIINKDILKFNPASYGLEFTDYSLIGAPPYYLTSRLFRHFLQYPAVRPLGISVIIQKEVAEKIIAKPPHSNLLAISVQFYGEPHIIKIISKSSFWPSPKVDSAILIINKIHKPKINEDVFFKIVRTGFSSPRKQIITNLTQKLTLSRTKIKQSLKNLNIEPSRRAQTLTVEEWVSLSKQLNIH